MAGARAQQAARTRERIIATARRLFTDPGYYATSTTDLVSAAGVGTRGALYHHFADKTALFREVFESVERDILARVAADIGRGSGFQILSEGLLSYLDAALDSAEVRQILLIDGPSVLGWQTWRSLEERYGLGAIRGMLRLGQKDGSIRAMTVDATSQMLLAAVDEAALYIAHSAAAHDARREASEGLSMLLAGLAG